jgi:Cu-Zn family superoxide dismutase
MAPTRVPLSEDSPLVSAQSAAVADPFSRRNLAIAGVMTIICALIVGLAVGLTDRSTGPVEQFRYVAAVSNGSIVGSATFTQRETGGNVTVSLSFTGIPPSVGYSNATPFVHGFHVHASGNLSDACKGAGPHLNAATSPHGAPYNLKTARHTGDLGNFATDATGALSVTFQDSVISLNPTAAEYVGGKAFMIHADGASPAQLSTAQLRRLTTFSPTTPNSGRLQQPWHLS